MKRARYSLLIALLAFAAIRPAIAVSPPAMTGPPPILIQTGEIVLPGAKGGGSLTYFEGHLYATDGKSGTLFVVEGKTEQLSATITGLPGCSGFAGIPGKGVGYVTVGARNAVGVIDLRTNTLRKTIPVGTSPSTVLYAPKANRVYVVCSHGRRAMLIDPDRERVVGTVTLGGTAAPFACVFPQDNRIYQRLHYPNRLAVIDPLRSTVVKWIRMKNEFDQRDNAPEGGRLYVSQGDDSTAPNLLMLPTGYYTLISADKDAVIFDRVQNRIYTTTRGGRLGTIIGDDTGEDYGDLISFVSTGPHAFALNDGMHHVYVYSGDGRITIFLSSPRSDGKTYDVRYVLPPKTAIPDDLKSQKFNVVVMIHVKFYGDGRLNVTLMKSSGIPELDDLCLKTYQKITFQPSYQDGYPADVTHEFRILFHKL